MSQLKQTPSQTVGPFFAYGLTPTQYGYDLKSLFTPVLAQPNAQGEHIRITGQVFDGAGNAVMDAMVEIAQPDGRDRPAALRMARDLQVEHAIETDHHPEAREDRRIVQRRHVAEAEQPLRIDDSVDAPRDVVGGCRGEDTAMEPPARDHRPGAARVSRFHGHAPNGSSSAA